MLKLARNSNINRQSAHQAMPVNRGRAPLIGVRKLVVDLHKDRIPLVGLDDTYQ